MSRNIFFTLTLSIALLRVSAQDPVPFDSLTYIERLAGVCKIWGLVKYYQPKVVRKKIDWDLAFVNCYENIKNVNDFESYNEQLKKLLAKAILTSKEFSLEDSIKMNYILKGELSKLDNFKILNDTSNYIRQPSFTWIKNNTIFSKEIQNLLFQIIIDYKPITNKYLKGSKVISHSENPFGDIDSVSEPYRMLGLFRYWNIVNYFYPYINLADKNWDSVLVENISRFEKANSYYSYFYQIQRLTTKINDSHAFVTQTDSKMGIKQTTQTRYLFYYYPPFKIEMLDTNIIITKVLNDSLAKSGALQIGDIILKVNSKLASNIISNFRNYRSASTEQAFQNDAKDYLIGYFGDTSLFNITVLRGKDTLKLTSISGMDYKSVWNSEKKKTPAYYLIKDSIGYINLDKAKPRDFRRAYRKYKNLSTLIFDMRGYPLSYAPLFIPKIFSRKPIPVANYFYPSKKYAGVFMKHKVPENYYTENTITLVVKMIFNTRAKIFPTFNNIYKGKVVVLIDNKSVSYAETVCMILKAYANNAIFIGTPTQGANGDVIDFFLPGGIKVCFTSLGWQFPNGKQLQRVGIIPDIKVKRTIETIKKDNDEILDRAIKFIQTRK